MATMSEHVELLESLRLMTAERNRLSTESEARAQDVSDLQDKNEQSKAELARYENGRLVMVNEIARLREELAQLHKASEEGVQCDTCERYRYETGHYPYCPVGEGAQRGSCDCNHRALSKTPEPRCRCGRLEWELGAVRILCGDGSIHYTSYECIPAKRVRCLPIPLE